MTMEFSRKNKLLTGLVIAALILLAKIFYIQIIDDKYKISAENNSMVYEIIYPTRGVIYDRNGEIIVGNKVAYDIQVTPREVKAFDTLLLARMLDTSATFLRDKMAEYRRNLNRIGFQPVTLLRQVSAEAYNRFAEVQYQFPGFRGQVRSIRDYPINAGGNLLGYVSEVDAGYIKAHPDEYRSGDYAGRTGIEAARERDLRGEKGYHIYLRNSRNQIESPYKDGEMDKEAVPGLDIVTTIDAGLQQYGQQLMQNKVGSIVAIEPGTGEILAMVSSPGIDVSQLADFSRHYNEIMNDPYKPMFNRTVQAPYPPGSVFKLVNGLIGLQEGTLRPGSLFPCSHGYPLGDHRPGCHGHKSPIDLEEAIMMSCNSYFCFALRDILENRKYPSIDDALDKWNDYVKSMGFGRKLGSDFPSELSGTIPDAKLYNRLYPKARGGWKFPTIKSISIGQGEVGVTPMQIANLAATVANRGYYYIPHIVKESPGIAIDPKYKERQYTMVDTTEYKKVIKGMWRAVNSGAGMGGTAWIAHVDGLDICGKTGTAQNPRGADNSVFICFAPMDDPKIAVAVYVENGGFGATWAAPIASLLVERYLTGEIRADAGRKDLEERMMQGNLLSRVKTD